ncbi:MAG TPA: YncE family protein [Polyangiaceae bacterium]
MSAPRSPDAGDGRAALLGFALSLALFGCGEEGTEAATDAPFPNRRPAFVLPAGDVGLSSDNGSDSVSVLDLAALAPLGSAPVGRDPVDRDGPHHVAIDRAAGLAYTALAYPPPAVPPGPHAAHGSAERAGYVQKLALEDLRPLAEVRVENNPGDIVLSEDGTLLVVSHFDLARATEESELEKRRAPLALIDPATLGAPRFVTTCIAPHGVALSRPAGRLAFVACYGEDAVAVVDTTDPEARPGLVAIGPGGSPGSPFYGPYAAVLSNDGERVAVSNTLFGDVRLFAVETREFLELGFVPDGTPYFAAWSADDGVLYVPTQSPDGLEAFDAESGERLRRRSFEREDCELPHEAVFGSDPAALFLVCEGDHRSPSVVLVLDPESFETLASLPVGVYPDRLAIGRAAP